MADAGAPKNMAVAPSRIDEIMIATPFDMAAPIAAGA